MTLESLRNLINLLLSGALLWSCQTSGSKPTADTPSDTSKQQSKLKADPPPQQVALEQSADNVTVSNSLETFTYSLSSNSLTSSALNKGLAKGYATDLSGRTKNPKAKDVPNLRAIVAAKVLAGEDFKDVLSATKRLMHVEMQSNAATEFDDQVRLELAIAALQNDKFTMAQFMISEISDAKNPKIKAAAFNLTGLLALRQKRFPEAAVAWRHALSIVPGYKPAILNLGFLALKYGDFATAKKYLSVFEGDWFAQYGVLVAERIAGNGPRVDGLCEMVLGRKPDYKPALLSCGLHKYQSKGQLAQAKEMLEKAMKGSGPHSIDEAAQRALHEIERASKKSAPPSSVAGNPKAAGGVMKTSTPKK